MASPPVGPRPNRRAVLNVTKTTKPKAAPRGSLTKPAPIKVAPKKATIKKASADKTAATDDAARQAVAERIVRKIFAEAGVPPEKITIGNSPRVATKATQAPVIALPRTPKSKVGSAAPKDESPATSDPAVTVPSNANARLVSKAGALREWYTQRFPLRVGVICTVAGLIFSAVGGLSLIPFVGAMYPDWQSFQRALVCETLNCQETTTTSTQSSTQSTTQTTSQGGTTQTVTTNTTSGTTNTTQSETAMPPPVVTFLTRPPSPLTAPTTVVVRAEYAGGLAVFAESRATGQRYELSRVGDPAGPDHTFALAPNLFPPAEYDLRARAVALRDNKLIYASGPRFRVEGPAPLPTGTQPQPSAGSTTPSSESGDDDEVAPAPTPEPTEPVMMPASPAGASTSATGTPPPVTLAYTRPAPGMLAITVLTPESQAVEVYAQRLSATAPVLVGVARRIEPNRWLLSYDTRGLPNGSYVLVARVKTVRGTLDTPRVPLFVDNKTPVPSATTTTTTRASQETTETIERLAQADTPLPDRSAYTAVLPEMNTEETSLPVVSRVAPDAPSQTQPLVAPLPVTTVPEPLRPVVRERFTENADELNDLFKRYASAVQTNDEGMRTLIEDELTKKRSRLVEATIAEGTRGVTASDLDQSLATEFERLKERVETFESLLRDRSGQNSAVDQDNDGVSDHDEVTLYETDPTAFDTDGDGVSDGAELMRGFDPRSSEQEAVMTYTSPKEFGIVREDVLTIAAVTPVIETDRERGTPPVQAEIRGTGIPNSFVTLFIFSSPTVVTVRTAEDGSFVYQFDKELEDGSHEVYVAVTDNTGDIVAKSNPFTFVKEAEAFTVVDAATAAPVASSDPSASVSIDQLYQVITAMVVLAFGLILLIFGIVMRREPTVTETPNEVSGASA